MNYEKIDQKIFESAMELAAEQGWNTITLTQAAQHAGVSVAIAQKRFACKDSLLHYLNQLANQAALEQPYNQQPTADYLFDVFMSRFDVFQRYRKGIISALHTVPFNPPLIIMLGISTQNSMRWIAESAEIDTHGLKGLACIKGLTAIWALNLRVWAKDTTSDLSKTMASLDQTIQKAGKIAPYFVVKHKSSQHQNEQKEGDESYHSDQEI